MIRLLQFSTIPLFLALFSTALPAVADNYRGGVKVNEITLTSALRATSVETFIYVTNVTDSSVTGRITFYDQEGNDVTALHCSVYRKNPSGPGIRLVASNTGTFQLPAASTRMVKIQKSEGSKCDRGHAVIEWSSDNPNLKKALTALMRINKRHFDRSSFSKFLLNNGDSF